jgi:hypothetical protein
MQPQKKMCPLFDDSSESDGIKLLSMDISGKKLICKL